MQVDNRTRRRGAFPKLLHWSVVAPRVAQWVLARLGTDLPRGIAQPRLPGCATAGTCL